jgi:methionyl-tRNA formyltransferase|tara:strand:+ start:7428 stop:8378 length:951 start_codon:yes stop_codon:yes gene_type:complete
MVSSPTNVAFFGTPEFAVPTLLGLVKSPEINLQIVVTQPDRPAGRKSSPSFTAVKAAAVEHEIPHILQPSLIDDDFLTTLTSLNVEAIIVIASGHMLPKTLCEHYGDRIVNLHASLLPKHRGASPISAALLSGDSETGVSLMQVVHKLDSGPIFAQKTLQISESDTTDSLSLSLSLLAKELLLTNLQSWLASEIRSTPQNTDDVTYAKKIVATDAKIDWNQPSAQIAKFIRAYIPWPVAYTEYQGQRFRIHESHSLPKFTPTSSIGSVIQLPDSRIAVQCGTGALQLSLIQKEGRKMMPVADFLNGNADFIGSVLG